MRTGRRLPAGGPVVLSSIPRLVRTVRSRVSHADRRSLRCAGVVGVWVPVQVGELVYTVPEMTAALLEQNLRVVHEWDVDYGEAATAAAERIRPSAKESRPRPLASRMTSASSSRRAWMRSWAETGK